MAKPRVFVSEGTEAGVYHVMSRVMERQFRLGPVERAVFVRMMRAAAAFHQVEVLTFCVMSNHFHLLVRVPQQPPDFDLPLERVVALWERAVGQEWSRLMQRRHRFLKENGCGEAIETWRRRMIGRMFSLSEFMKSLKQRFGTWYNRRNERCGTLWEGRYTSVIVEDEARSLRTMATYIDLNPVRAGLVRDPGRWRWCGYAEALKGSDAAASGLAYITGMRQRGKWTSRNVAEALWAYRQLLVAAGVEQVASDGRMMRAGISEPVRRRWRMEQEGAIRWEVLMGRVRNLSAGVIIGSREFIEKWIATHRWWFGGREPERRRTGAQPIGRAADWNGLMNLRRLRPRSGTG